MLRPRDGRRLGTRTRWLLPCLGIVALTLARVGGPGTAVKAQSTADFDPANVGEWSRVWPWPSDGDAAGFAGHLHVLPTGEVLFWGDHDSPNPQERIWTPSNPDDGDDPGLFRLAGDLGYNHFCSGHAFLRDGTLLVAGGHPPGAPPAARAALYDPFRDTWKRIRNMNTFRWYGTATTLADGGLLMTSGTNGSSENLLPQIWSGGPFWRNLYGAQEPVSPGSFYPRMHVAPNGQVFLSGPYPQSRYLDTAGAGHWTDVAVSSEYRHGGTSVMYEPGKVLVAGGGSPSGTSSAETIDLNVPQPAWQQLPPMAYARLQNNGTILPDGTVLITGGGVEGTELWDPVTRAWRTMAPAAVARPYHSTAALLPDGRVLSAGGDSQPNAEIYKPPYFFKGRRPRITSAPPTVRYGETFMVGVPVASRIADVTWIRLSSVTHAFNHNQRFNRLDFTTSSFGPLRVTAPARPELAPPGHYMLFVLNQAGVPSEARIVKLTEPVLPEHLEVDAVAKGASDGNRVFEPGEGVVAAPSWRNPTHQNVDLNGSIDEFSGPASAVYTIFDGNARYGTIAPGEAGSCQDTDDCYALRVTTAPDRPLHWDAVLTETTSAGPSHRWTVHLGDSFADVPRSNPFYRLIETLLHNGVTAGCGGGSYCPDATATRAQAATMVLASMHGPGYAPPACVAGQERFSDVPASNPFCAWIEELARRGVVTGCGPGMYCPEAAATREQMAVLVLATLEGGGYAPPLCVPGQERFVDVPASSPFCPWVEELVRRGAVTGCNPMEYCPTAGVSRGEASQFLVGGFGLRLYE